MKILIAHNRYQQRGGEDAVADFEANALRDRGHIVERLTVDNDNIDRLSRKILASARSLHNPQSIRLIRALLEDFRPDVVHFHNTFPTLSPGAVESVLSAKVPVVQTVHNYRLVCANAQLFRNDAPCNLCISSTKIEGVINGCYKSSSIGSVVSSISAQRLKALYNAKTFLYTLVCLNTFSRDILIQDGFRGDGIVIKGNSVPDPGLSSSVRSQRAVFVGRLTSEKGVDLLMRIADRLNGMIDVVGDGPARSRLAELASSRLKLHGWLPSQEVLQLIKSASVLLTPSKWYEGFPIVIAEALACGTPVLASSLGGLPELVEGSGAGWCVPPDLDEEWIRSINTFLENPALVREFGLRGRLAYDTSHSPQSNIDRLIEIYSDAVLTARSLK
ncbi:glycosyltransferase family 4 protein [Brevundimonas sp. TWP2-3-4b1]|uniref:glycosyltransferase family 4 protein n=1 Tax=Brevundimonas sp. TWP2-3-4b1 TaxID=2804580 RepID=UPI003CF16A8A